MSVVCVVTMMSKGPYPRPIHGKLSHLLPNLWDICGMLNVTKICKILLASINKDQFFAENDFCNQFSNLCFII